MFIKVYYDMLLILGLFMNNTNRCYLKHDLLSSHSIGIGLFGKKTCLKYVLSDHTM